MQFIKLVCIACLMLGCSISESGIKQENTLIGEWRWVTSSFLTRGMQAPEITTPQSTGIEMMITFKQNGTAVITHNGQEVETLEYLLSPATDSYPVLRFNEYDYSLHPGLEEGPVQVIGDTLTISGGYNDAGSNQVFVRL